MWCVNKEEKGRKREREGETDEMVTARMVDQVCSIRTDQGLNNHNQKDKK